MYNDYTYQSAVIIHLWLRCLFHRLSLWLRCSFHRLSLRPSLELTPPYPAANSAGGSGPALSAALHRVEDYTVADAQFARLQVTHRHEHCARRNIGPGDAGLRPAGWHGEHAESPPPTTAVAACHMPATRLFHHGGQ